MRWINSVLREIFGLFVDDGVFAVTIVVWLAIAALVLPLIGVPQAAKGPILFAGLAFILLESVARRGRR